MGARMRRVPPVADKQAGSRRVQQAVPLAEVKPADRADRWDPPARARARRAAWAEVLVRAVTRAPAVRAAAARMGMRAAVRPAVRVGRVMPGAVVADP